MKLTSPTPPPQGCACTTESILCVQVSQNPVCAAESILCAQVRRLTQLYTQHWLTCTHNLGGWGGAREEKGRIYQYRHPKWLSDWVAERMTNLAEWLYGRGVRYIIKQLKPLRFITTHFLGHDVATIALNHWHSFLAPFYNGFCWLDQSDKILHYSNTVGSKLRSEVFFSDTLEQSK